MHKTIGKAAAVAVVGTVAVTGVAAGGSYASASNGVTTSASAAPAAAAAAGPSASIYALRAADQVNAAALILQTPVLPAGTYAVDAVVDGRYLSAGTVRCTLYTATSTGAGAVLRGGGVQRFSAADTLRMTVSVVVRSTVPRRLELECVSTGPGFIRPNAATSMAVTKLAGSTVVQVRNVANDDH